MKDEEVGEVVGEERVGREKGQVFFIEFFFLLVEAYVGDVVEDEVVNVGLVIFQFYIVMDILLVFRLVFFIFGFLLVCILFWIYLDF